MDVGMHHANCIYYGPYIHVLRLILFHSVNGNIFCLLLYMCMCVCVRVCEHYTVNILLEISGERNEYT